jgi:hypothetical protein
MCDKYKPVGGGPLKDDFKNEKEQPNIRPQKETPRIQSDSKDIDEIPDEEPENKSKWC